MPTFIKQDENLIACLRPRSPLHQHLRAVRRGVAFLAIVAATVLVLGRIGFLSARASAFDRTPTQDLCAGYELPCAP